MHQIGWLSFLVVFLHSATLNAATWPTNLTRLSWGWSAIPEDLTDVVAADEGGSGMALAVHQDGRVKMWGNLEPALTPPEWINNAVDVACTDFLQAALLADGRVVTWPDLPMVQETPYYVPPPRDLQDVVQIAGGRSHILALTADGKVHGWGAPCGSYEEHHVPPGIDDAVAIAVADDHNVILRRDGTVIAWGNGDYYGPLAFPPEATNITAIATSRMFSVLLRADGRVMVVGNFVPKSTMTNGVAIACGSEGWLALGADGTIESSFDSLPAGLNKGAAIHARQSSYNVWMPEAYFLTQPTSQTVEPGYPLELSVIARSVTPMHYQWFFDGAEIIGATNASYRNEATELSDTGRYHVMVSNTSGDVISETACVSVGTPIFRDQSGQTLEITEGDALTLSAEALGTAPMNWQWRKDGVLLPGFTAAELVIELARPGDAGTYIATVSNSHGVIQGPPVTVVIWPVPLVDQGQPVFGGWVRLRDAAARDVAQTFRVGMTGRLEAIHVGNVFDPILEPFPIAYELLDTVDGKPGKLLLGRTVVRGVPTGHEIRFPQGDVFLNAGQLYALTIHTDAPLGGSRMYDYLAAGSDAYPAGNLWERAPGGDWVAVPAEDLVFSTEMWPGIPEVRITQPTAGGRYRVGDTVELEAWLDSGLPLPLQATFRCNTQILAASSGNPVTGHWVPASPGLHELRVEVKDGLNRNYVSRPVTISVKPDSGPVNDDFADRHALVGELASDSSFDSSGATVEPGEPFSEGSGQTLWWTWTAPRSGSVTLETRNGAGLPVLVDVFTGSGLDMLVPYCGGTNSCAFLVSSNATYHLRVDPDYGALSGASLDLAMSDLEITSISPGGTLTLPVQLLVTATRTPSARDLRSAELLFNDLVLADCTAEPWQWTAAVNASGRGDLRLRVTDHRGIVTFSSPVPIHIRPANDEFGRAKELFGYAFTIADDNSGATRNGDPQYASNVGGKSIWYRWTAPANGLCTIRNTGARFPLFMGAFMGPRLSQLTPVAVNMFAPVPAIAFAAVAGNTYYIDIDGFSGQEGPLEWSLTLRPHNDDFATRQYMVGATHDALVEWDGASLENGESELAGVGNGSLWWSWRCEQTGTATVHTRSEGVCNRLVVGTGSSLARFQEVAQSGMGCAQESTVSFLALAGQVYQIGLFGSFGVSGEVRIGLNLDALRILSPADGSVFSAPANIPLQVGIAGSSVAISRVTFYAQGQPLSAGPGTQFLWTDVAAGSYTLEAEGVLEDGTVVKSLPCAILVYEGTQVPTPRVWAGPQSDCSYVSSAVGALYVLGSPTDFFSYEFNWLVLLRPIVASAYSPQFGLAPMEPARAPELATRPEGVRSWSKIEGVRSGNVWSADPGKVLEVRPYECWALSDGGVIFAHGEHPLPFPPEVNRWVSFSQAGGPIAIGDNGRAYHLARDPIYDPPTGLRWVDGQFVESLFVSLTEDGRLFVNGTAFGWGFNMVELVRPVHGQRWTKIVCGLLTALVQADDGSLFRITLTSSMPTLTAIEPPPDSGHWVDCVAGGLHFLGLTADGRLWAWGRNWELQLGTGSGMGDFATPAQVIFPEGVTAWTTMAAGLSHSVAIGSDGHLYSWGGNTFGQLGLGLMPDQPLPTRVDAIGSLVGIPIIHSDGQSVRLPDGTFRVTFASSRNHRYRVQYSDDLSRWMTASTPVLGTGGPVVWIDIGPPETDTPPSATSNRYYRIIFAPE